LLNKVVSSLLIKNDEKKLTLYFILFFIVLGSGMAIGRGTTDVLFIKRYGIEYLPVMYIILGSLLFISSTVYAAFSDRLSPEKFFKILNLVLIGLLLFAWSLMRFFEFDFVYPLYFLIYEIASEILIIHATLYLAKNMDSLQAKRLTPVILAGAQIGSIIGGSFLALTATSLGVQNLLFAWCVLLSIGVIMITYYHNKTGHSLYFRHPRKNSNQLRQSIQELTVGLKFIKNSELVRYASFALFFLVIVFYILIYSTNKIYNNVFKTEESLTAFFGIMVVVTNSIALFLQLLVTNRSINYFGIKKVNLFFPFTSLICFIALLFSFTLPAAILASINKDSIMPALRNPVSNLFYNALPNFIQGRARAISVAVVIPLALLFCGVILWATQYFQNTVYFLSVGLILTVLYGFYNFKMNAAYSNEIVSNLEDTLFVPGDNDSRNIQLSNDEVREAMINGVQNKEVQICISYSKALAESYPEIAEAKLLERYNQANSELKNELLPILEDLNLKALDIILWHDYKSADPHLQSTIIKALYKLDDKKIIQKTQDLLNHQNSRIAAAAIYGCILNNKNLQIAYNILSELLSSNKPGDIISALEILVELNDNTHPVLTSIGFRKIKKHLNSNNNTITRLTLQVLAMQPSHSMDDLHILLIRIYHTSNPELRVLTLKCAHILKKDDAHNFIFSAFEDNHPLVRELAISMFQKDNIDETFTIWLKNKNQGSPRTQASILKRLIERKVSNEIIEDIALAKVLDAKKISNAIKSLRQNSNMMLETNQPIQLTLFALQERLIQIIEISLLALKSIEDPYTINIIQAGIKSNDKRISAQAMDALRSIDNQQIATLLANILEDSLDHTETHNNKAKDCKEILLWCIRRHDPWLKVCAEKALRVC